MTPITRSELDEAGYENPNHPILHLRPLCHRDASAVVTYDKRIGALRLFCVECDSVVAEIAVAWGLN